jgi:hypothetical protein
MFTRVFSAESRSLGSTGPERSRPSFGRTMTISLLAFWVGPASASASTIVMPPLIG